MHSATTTSTALSARSFTYSSTAIPRYTMTVYWDGEPLIYPGMSTNHIY